MTATTTDTATKPKTARRASKRAEAAAKKPKANGKAPKADHNQYNQMLRSFVYRVENLNREREDLLEPIRNDMKLLGEVVKDAGFKMKVIREIVRRRALAHEDHDLVDQYELAFGTQEEEKTQ